MLRNNVDNENIEDKREIQNSKLNSKTKKYTTSRNNLDIDKIEKQFELQIGSNESKNRKDYTSRNNMEQVLVVQKIKLNQRIRKLCLGIS